MTPALIRQLLDIGMIPEPEVDDACVQRLMDAGLVRDGEHGYECTERGKKMFELLQEVPLPVQVWTDPRSGK